MTNMHKSARGKEIDMHRLAVQNELTVAVSNVKINARGDELGPGGQIVRKNDEQSIFSSSGTPIERNVAKPALSVPAQPKAAPKVTATQIETPVIVESKPTFTPVVDTPNALIQQSQSKPNNHNNKGK